MKHKVLVFFTVLFILVLPTEILFSQIYVNQAGYISGKVKYVYMPVQSDSFYVRSVSDSAVVYRGNVMLWKTNDPATGLTIYRGDFTGFTKSGKYFITNNSGDKSYSFEISDSVYNSVLRKSLKGFYFQRCGEELSEENAGVYNHPACHVNDGTFHPSTDTSGHLSAAGGWHDAGDYGKYAVNAGITVGTLLMAYEQFPSRIGYDNSNIPESGNGIPDILDEVKYELDWLLKMQRADGGVFCKLTRAQFSGYVMPQTDIVTRYIYQVTSPATGDFAAVMAKAYRSFKNYNKDYADKCLNAAKKAWTFLEAHPTIVPPGGFNNPPGTNTGTYSNGDDSDERLWAAAELFVSTGESKYENYFQSKYNPPSSLSTMGWPNVATMAYLTYLTNSASFLNQSIKSKLKDALLNFCDTAVDLSQNDGLNLTIKTTDYYWGSNSEVLNRAVLLIIGYEQSGNQNYYNTALEQLNYILGVNANDICYVTGIGDHHVMNPHHRPSIADNVVEPVPGLVAGGPNQYLQDDVLKSMFNSNTPPAMCYADNADSYASNEIAINWNAPLVFAAGYFSMGDYPVSVLRNSTEFPQKFILFQNFPNPFNPSTTITYSVPADNKNKYALSHVTLKVYDTLGREVSTLVDEHKSYGTYKVVFDTSSEKLSGRITSGIYFYTLRIGDYSITKKMELIK